MERRRQRLGLDDERMIARRLEGPVNAAKDRLAAVQYRRHLAVDRQGRAHHLAAESLADRLMPQADAEDRDLAAGAGDEVEAHARLMRRAGAGREHDRVRASGHHVIDADLVIAMHGDPRAKLAEIMDEIEGEAVVIIDQRDVGHGSTGPDRERQSLPNALFAPNGRPLQRKTPIASPKNGERPAGAPFDGTKAWDNRAATLQRR